MSIKVIYIGTVLIPPPLVLLHYDRQIVHDNDHQGMNKAHSAIHRLRLINPSGTYNAITEKLVPSNALKILADFDLIVDATDNFTARYIINDACVILNKPFISASAVGLEGQITVIIPHQTACYRCLYPNPSLTENCRSCANAGILGPVAGMIGCLEAIEAVKLVLQRNSNKNPATAKLQVLAGRQLFYDASIGEAHNFDLPSRNNTCSVCGDQPSIRGEFEVEKFIQDMSNTAKLASEKYLGELAPQHQISWSSYHEQYQSNLLPFHLVIDVRAVNQYTLTSLSLEKMQKYSSLEDTNALLNNDSNSNVTDIRAITFNLPLSLIQKDDNIMHLKQLLQKLVEKSDVNEIPIYTVCRRGIDSTVAARLFLKEGFSSVYNLIGGLTAWKEEVDPNFPMY